MTNPDSTLKKQRYHFADKGPDSQSYNFSSSHVQMWKLDNKEGWVSKNWCFQIVLKKTLESFLDCKEINPVSPKGNQPWVFIRTNAKASKLWLPDGKSPLIGKDSDAGRDWRQKEKGMTEDEMVGWSLTRWSRIWPSSRSWQWTGKPGVLQSKGSWRVRHNWATELNLE